MCVRAFSKTFLKVKIQWFREGGWARERRIKRRKEGGAGELGLGRGAGSGGRIGGGEKEEGEKEEVRKEDEG